MEYHVRPFEPVYRPRVNFYVFGQLRKGRVGTAATRWSGLKGVETLVDYKQQRCFIVGHLGQGILQIGHFGAQCRNGIGAVSLVMVALTMLRHLVSKMLDL
ncbi:MAG TPA: hypothetical protein VIY67_00900 [Nitrospiraceae bacterium]